MRSLCGLVLGACLGMAGGCEDSGATVFIAGAVLADEGDCTVTPGNTFLLRGAYDRSGMGHYTIFPVYVNQIRSRTTPLGTDTNGVHITDAEVELQATDGTALSLPGLPNPFTVATNAFVPSASGSTPGRGVGSIELIPIVYSAALPPAGTIIASVRAFGETNGTVDVETDDFRFPIDICDGCLFMCAEEPAFCCTPGENCLSQIDCTP